VKRQPGFASRLLTPRKSDKSNAIPNLVLPGLKAKLSKGSVILKQIESLSRDYDFTSSTVAEIPDVSQKTLSRYHENAKPLSAQQKDRIAVVETILELGKRVLGSEAEVKRWLFRPVHSIENQRPIDLIISESGRRRVENVLLQIEGGA
jgi:putative toxin-antitoxin system antitoxin component (TIGR02293 family)